MFILRFKVGNPLRAKYTSSDPGHIPKVLVVTLIFFEYFLSELTKPIRISECPFMYFVPASIIILTPSFIGSQKRGDAQVLSRTVGIFFFFAIVVILGISRISNVAVPGDSKIN